MEFSLTQYVAPETIKARLNAVIAPGFYAESCGYIANEYKSLMSTVAMCEWFVKVDNITNGELEEKIKRINESTEVFVEKHTKRGYREVEIREGVFDLSMVVDIPNTIHMRLASGGKMNVSPKLVLAAMDIEQRYAKIMRRDI